MSQTDATTHPIKPTGFLDRAIETLSPAWAAKRYYSRAVIGAARSLPPHRFQASYRGAIGTRTSTPWGASSSYRGGTTQDRHQQGTMRDRGRRAYRESVIARSLLDTETDNVVGAGLSLQMGTDSDEFNIEAEARFYQWLDGADVAGKMTASDWFRATWREPRKDGDGGIVLVMRGGYPYLQYIPGDRIINPLGQYDPLKMFDGVECDPTGRAVRFWVRDDTEYQPNYASIPIDARDFVYLSHRDDPLAIRGSSVYGPIFGELDELDGYRGGVTLAARLGTMFGLIEKRKNPSAALSGLTSMTNSQGEQQKVVTYENGMMKVIGSEDSVFQVQATQPLQQAPDWVRACFRVICLRFDMPLEIGQKDLSQVNFSGGRIGLIGYYRSTRVKQDWVITRCWNRIVFWWLSKERQRQELGFADAFKTKFPEQYGKFELHGQEWAYNDPLTEAQADLLEISMGIKSEQLACEERGRDWAKNLSQIATARKKKQDLGIPTVVSSHTRDELTKVTAVDANGNPVSGGPSPEDKAMDFKRSVVLSFLADKTVNDVIYNITQVPDLLVEVGLPLDRKVQSNPDQGVPLLPVIADNGQLVTGQAIFDPQGDLVGGDVESGTVVNVPDPNAPPSPTPAPTPTAAPASNSASIEKLAEAVTHQTTELLAAMAKQTPLTINVNGSAPGSYRFVRDGDKRILGAEPVKDEGSKS